MLNEKELGVLVRKTNEKLNAMMAAGKRIDALEGNSVGGFDMSSDEQRAALFERAGVIKSEAGTILKDLSELTNNLQSQRPFWTKSGFMMRTRSAAPLTSDSLLGKEVVGLLDKLLDETIRIRLGNETKLMTADDLVVQAQDAISSGDFQTLRLLSLEANSRSDNKGKYAAKNIKSMEAGLVIPEQSEKLELIEDAIAVLDRAREIYFKIVSKSTTFKPRLGAVA